MLFRTNSGRATFVAVAAALALCSTVASVSSAAKRPVASKPKSRASSKSPASSRVAKPTRANTSLYQPNGRPPNASAPFDWSGPSPDPAVRAASSFEAATTAIVPNNKIFKLLIIGSDARPGEDFHKTRGDSIHVFLWNPASNKGVLVGIPRDSYVDLGGGKKGKITGALTGQGPDNMLRVVNGLSKLDIKHYVITGFAGFSRMVDDIGGVNVLVDPMMNDPLSGATFAKGWFAMNGPAALAFNRNRHTVVGGDLGRSANQGRFLLYGLAKLREETSNVAGLVRWVETFRRNADTNLAPTDFLVLAQIARQINPANLQNVVLTGKNIRVGSGKASTDAVQLDPGYAGLFVDVGRDAVNDGK